MLTYAQIEAIHEAMRELESVDAWAIRKDVDFRVYEADRVDRCFAKIRAALAGEKDGE